MNLKKSFLVLFILISFILIIECRGRKKKKFGQDCFKTFDCQQGYCINKKCVCPANRTICVGAGPGFGNKKNKRECCAEGLNGINCGTNKAVKYI